MIDRYEAAVRHRLEGTGPKANATVRDLQGLRPGNPPRPEREEPAKARTDQELLDSVFLPHDGAYVCVRGSQVTQGNHRRFELLSRARAAERARRAGEELPSTISYDTPIYIQWPEK